jgi:hypothetical protein
VGNLKYGDVVKVKGYDQGRQATVLEVNEDNEVRLQMGTKVFRIGADKVSIMCRSNKDRYGNELELKLNVGDKVKYIYFDPPADPEQERPIRYGEITKILSEKRVNVLWANSGIDKAERISRLKWVPDIPLWFQKQIGGN